MSDVDGYVKGTHAQAIFAFIARKRGTAGLDEFFATVNRTYGTNYSPDDFPVERQFPYFMFLEWLHIADAIIGTGDLSKVPEIGRFTVKHLGPYSHIYRIDDLHELVDNVIASWNVVYDFGRLAKGQSGPEDLVLEYHDFPIDEARCQYYKGSLEGTLEMKGLTGTVEEIRCVRKGADHCAYHLKWGSASA